MSQRKSSKRVWTVILSVLLGLFIGFFIGGLSFLAMNANFFSSNSASRNEISIENNEGGEKVKVRQLHTGFPIILDSIKGLSLIPISQTSDGITALSDEISYQSGYGGRTSYRHYVNMILYNQSTGAGHTLFNQKLLITDYTLLFQSDSLPIVLFEVVLEDNNKDKKLSDDDFIALAIYNFKQDTLLLFKEENLSLDAHKISNTRDYVYLQFAQDLNRDGEIDKNSEPVILKKYGIAEGLTDVLPDEILTEVRKTIN